MSRLTPVKISVVTPSFNQAEFLPACLDAVSGQTQPAFEHLVFDPGSDDGSREIAADAAGVTLYAEADDGQADAVARGMRLAKGDIIGWLNSDDVYASDDVFEMVAARFAASDQPDLVYGRGTYIDADGGHLRDAYVVEDPSQLGERLHHEVGILQPTVFLRASVFDVIEPPREHLHFAMDYDLWIRAASAGLRFAFLPEILASGRYYLDNKTMGMREKSYTEVLEVTTEHFGAAHVRWARRLAEFRVAGADGILDSGEDADKERVEAETARILWAFNYPTKQRETLKACKNIAPYGETVKFMTSKGLSLDAPSRVVPTGQIPPRMQTYNVDDTTWAFDRSFVDEQLTRGRSRIEALQTSRRSDTAIIVGNGPSLNKTDLTLLDGVDTFVTNFAHLKPELFERATYLAVVNNLVAEQGAPIFNQVESLTLFAPWWLSYCLAPSDNCVFVPSIGHPEFSTDITKNVSWRHTVSFFCMQLAYGLGYRRVGLIGFDHSYRQSATYAEGDRIEQVDDDENHFDPNYFKAKSWHAADVDNMEAMYRLAAAAFDEDNREIVNCTVGGHLELFPRAELASWL